MILRIIYTLFIGIFLAIFVGVGISAFYEGPVYPEMTADLKYQPVQSDKCVVDPKIIAQRTAFDKAEKQYNHDRQVYARNVSTIAVIAAVILVVISLTMLKKIFLISDGILLGGALTLIYSTIRGAETEDTKFLFIVVSIGLVVSFVLGYIKFIQPLQNGKK